MEAKDVRPLHLNAARFLAYMRVDVAEDNVAPTELTGGLAQQFLQAVPILPRYFSDAFTHPESCRGRWRLSPESKFAYPDDEHFAQLYDEYGVV